MQGKFRANPRKSSPVFSRMHHIAAKEDSAHKNSHVGVAKVLLMVVGVGDALSTMKGKTKGQVFIDAGSRVTTITSLHPKRNLHLEDLFVKLITASEKYLESITLWKQWDLFTST